MIGEETKVYQLKKPVLLKGQDGSAREIKEVKLTEPNMLQLEGLNLTNLTLLDYKNLFGKIADQPTIIFEKMKPVDGYACVDIMAGFLAGGQETGEKSLES